MIKSDSIYEYVGSLHIHSNYSDGLRPIPEIAKIAEKSGLDFLLFADHMTLEPLKMGMERWFGPVLSIIGYEINYPWLAWDAEGYNGIEIWNHSSEWLERLTHSNKYFRILHPLSYLQGPEPETLARWDEQNRAGVMSGIGGTDAHAYPCRFGPITIYIFRYKVLFKGIRTHILLEEKLTKDVLQARNAVLQALKNARCFISNHRWGNAHGFQFTALSGDNRWLMGDTVNSDSISFEVRSPLPGKISLLRDGKVVATAEGTELSYLAAITGAYRVKITRKDKPWIYSNHIRFRKLEK